MTARLRLFWTITAAVTAVAIVASLFLGGETGLKGMLLGLFATSFSLVALRLAIGMATARPGSAPATRIGTTIVVLAFFVKLPLFIALGSLAHRIGGNAPGCFLAGLALVYCALVGWALAQS